MQLRVAEQYITQFGNIAKEGNTLVVPANLSDVSSMLALAMNAIKGMPVAGSPRSLEEHPELVACARFRLPSDWRLAEADPLYIFIASAGAIIPLAGWMGRSTEWISEHLGPGIGGLLNATFGNAAELIIAIMALRAGLHDVVKASITGSIIGNILLVLGLADPPRRCEVPRTAIQPDGSIAAVHDCFCARRAVALIMPAMFHLLSRERRHRPPPSATLSVGDFHCPGDHLRVEPDVLAAHA